MHESKKLIFVYNADSSFFNQIGDLIHKTVSPATYQCRLCGLTYSGVSQNRDWKTFINTLPIKADFLHKDEFTKQYPQYSSIQFPAVFLKTDKEITEFISASKINQQKTLNDLKTLVSTKTVKL